eukprot:TRINITY_DN31640_c0_g1_i1.p1 TRINITY_DN31640_c0_g1~~TRINITY_DN31640_c0_g1_i1.p1  ORF type:complete len:824 (-),score=220.06 TRINITY_DN31640_c0_g1_i1:461-2932(-)
MAQLGRHLFQWRGDVAASKRELLAAAHDQQGVYVVTKYGCVHILEELLQDVLVQLRVELPPRLTASPTRQPKQFLAWRILGRDLNTASSSASFSAFQQRCEEMAWSECCFLFLLSTAIYAVLIFLYLAGVLTVAFVKASRGKGETLFQASILQHLKDMRMMVAVLVASAPALAVMIRLIAQSLYMEAVKAGIKHPDLWLAFAQRELELGFVLLAFATLLQYMRPTFLPEDLAGVHLEMAAVCLSFFRVSLSVQSKEVIAVSCRRHWFLVLMEEILVLRGFLLVRTTCPLSHFAVSLLLPHFLLWALAHSPEYLRSSYAARCLGGLLQSSPASGTLDRWAWEHLDVFSTGFNILASPLMWLKKRFAVSEPILDDDFPEDTSPARAKLVGVQSEKNKKGKRSQCKSTSKVTDGRKDATKAKPLLMQKEDGTGQMPKEASTLAEIHDHVMQAPELQVQGREQVQRATIESHEEVSVQGPKACAQLRRESQRQKQQNTCAPKSSSEESRTQEQVLSKNKASSPEKQRSKQLLQGKEDHADAEAELRRVQDTMGADITALRISLTWAENELLERTQCLDQARAEVVTERSAIQALQSQSESQMQSLNARCLQEAERASLAEERAIAAEARLLEAEAKIASLEADTGHPAEVENDLPKAQRMLPDSRDTEAKLREAQDKIAFFTQRAQAAAEQQQGLHEQLAALARERTALFQQLQAATARADFLETQMMQMSSVQERARELKECTESIELVARTPTPPATPLLASSSPMATSASRRQEVGGFFDPDGLTRGSSSMQVPDGSSCIRVRHTFVDVVDDRSDASSEGRHSI